MTTDFFAAPFDDPFLVGRIGLLNAASDLFAVGAKPVTALIQVELPTGSETAQEQMLRELLEGALCELRKMNATLIGGHTIEGSRLTVGFTMLGDQVRTMRLKSSLQIGDRLILTKPLGVGLLLAAHMRSVCQADWMTSLQSSMLSSNEVVLPLLDEFDIQGVTDVTGFGLAGHLWEMLCASRCSAELDLDQIPLLRGTAEVISSGIESSLAPANRTVERFIQADERVKQKPGYAAIFDPQTSGGMLLSVSEFRTEEILQSLQESGASSACCIGSVIDSVESQPFIQLR